MTWDRDQKGSLYVSSFNDIMVTNRNMVQYRKDKRYDCRIVRLNLCKILGIKLLSSLSGRRKLCVLGLRLERLEITAIKRPLSAPSISASIATLSSATQPALSSLRQNRSILLVFLKVLNLFHTTSQCDFKSGLLGKLSVSVLKINFLSSFLCSL